MLGSRFSGARVLVAALSLVAAAGPAGANGSATDGMRGLLRLPSADVGAPGFFGGTVWGSYARGAYESWESVRDRPETIKFGGSQVALGYAPTPRIELALHGSAETQFLNSEAAAVSANSFGISNLGLGVKTLLNPGEGRPVRVAALLDFASSLGNDDAFAGSWNADAFDITGRVALTYEPLGAEALRGLRTHAVAGYLNRTSDFDPLAFAATASGPTPSRLILHGDQFLYGAGVEYAVPRGWTLFTEWSGEYDLESEGDFMDNPMRVSPGFRWSAPGGTIAWTSAVDVSLASEEAGPGWELISGISLGSYFHPTSGHVFGVVRDEATGTPIANARIVSRDGSAPAQTDADGRFRADLDEGYTVLEVSAEGYVTKTRVVEIEAHGDSEIDLTLPKRNMFGTVEGRMRDAKTHAGVAGRARVQGVAEWTPADPATGRYRLKNVADGPAVLEFESDEHRTIVANVHVVAGEVASHDVTLEVDPHASWGRVAGVVTDATSGQPVSALVTARGANANTKSTQTDGSGRYEIRLEPGAWEIVVASAGHSARREAVSIAQRDRQSRDWKLSSVPPQMELAGVVFDQGTATIKRTSFAALEDAAKFLTDNPSVRVVIEGHTDDQGTPAGNLALSQRRADAVLKYFVVNHGVDPSRLDARGVGADRPVVPNDTPENRAKNRRIELIVEAH